MIEKVSALLLFCAPILTLSLSRDVHSREKRFLLFPKSTPTRHTFITGFGIPLSLEQEAITMGLLMKAFYFLPDVQNTFQNFPHFPDVLLSRPPTITQPVISGGRNDRRKRETAIDKATGQIYERYVEEVDELGNEELKNCSKTNSKFYDESFEDEFPEDEKLIDQQRIFTALNDEEELMDTKETRWFMYDGLSRLLSSKGLQGRSCVLRGICEAADIKFTHHSGLFSELAHIIFTPSTTHDPIVNPQHYDYLKAEKLGEEGEPCNEIFRDCKKSLMDIFTQVYDSELFKFN